MNTYASRQAGAASGALIVSIVAGLLALVFGSVMIWALINYNDQKTNVDKKIDVAVAAAKQEQATEDEAKFLEREKEPFRQFVGLDDLGRVTFNYPKTWSVYVGEETSSEYNVYFNPISVPSTDSGKQYALRVTVESQSYEDSLEDYASLVSKGDLKSSPIEVNGFSGNRIDGKFDKDTEGSMVIFKVRDKSLKVYTEIASFKTDFEEIILQSLSFNP